MDMYTISKEFHFSASHHLHGLPEEHQCRRDHGHNYIVKIELKGHQLQKDVEFLQDYGALKPIKDWIEDTLEHRNLNDVVPGNPTAENIARWIYWKWKRDFPLLSAVEVSETPKTNARYEQTNN